MPDSRFAAFYRLSIAVNPHTTPAASRYESRCWHTPKDVKAVKVGVAVVTLKQPGAALS
jgi:hypothetical protein